MDNFEIIEELMLDAMLTQLHAVYGEQIVWHLYKGYCSHHGIPDQSTFSK